MDDYYDENEFQINEDIIEEITFDSNNYSVLKKEEFDEINEIRINLIKEASEFTCLSHDEAIRLLIYYKWNIETLKDKFYDSKKVKIFAGIDPDKTALNLIKKGIKGNNKECSICFNESSENDPLYSLKCKHNFCSDCWFGHLQANLYQINTVLSATCPQESCNLYVTESFLYKFFETNKIELEKFKRGLLKNFTEKNSEIKWCPDPKCCACIRCTIKSSKEIDCVCGTNFCFKCLKPGHRPCSCEMLKGWENKKNLELPKIDKNTKKCPKCHIFIEKKSRL